MTYRKAILALCLLAGCVTAAPMGSVPEEQITAGCYRVNCGEEFLCYCWDPDPKNEHSVYLERRCFGSQETCYKELAKAGR